VSVLVNQKDNSLVRSLIAWLPPVVFNICTLNFVTHLHKHLLIDKRQYKGTRYITEDLIRRLTKCENLVLVGTLDLSTSAESDKQFRYIENLDKCERLHILNLSNNRIERIEKLEKLCQLRELHLSSNRIRKIEGLEHMSNLQVLNLAFNNIEHLPVWIAKKLRSLHTINLQRNKIFSLHEITKLKTLKNLTSLSLAETPISSLPHYHLFLIFHLRSLEMLDGQPISPQEREQAHQRFHMEEVERLEQELELRAEEIAQLQRERTTALEELERRETLNQNLRQQQQEQQRSREELRRELDTKSELLKQKTVELTRACQKHYELEQELAFHKIDAKFEPLPASSQCGMGCNISVTHLRYSANHNALDSWPITAHLAFSDR
uniref:Centriolin n=1 Tax=Sinocyclocheilus anshuiensis TaxID=1608454 RepID=A0A671KF75_9TELE